MPPMFWLYMCWKSCWKSLLMVECLLMVESLLVVESLLMVESLLVVESLLGVESLLVVWWVIRSIPQMHHPTDRIVHTMAFVIPVMEHCLEQEIAQWVHHEGSIQWPIAPWANTFITHVTQQNQIQQLLKHGCKMHNLAEHSLMVRYI